MPPIDRNVATVVFAASHWLPPIGWPPTYQDPKYMADVQHAKEPSKVLHGFNSGNVACPCFAVPRNSKRWDESWIPGTG